MDEKKRPFDKYVAGIKPAGGDNSQAAKLDPEKALENFVLTVRPNGQVISRLAGTSADTCTWVRFEAGPVIDNQLREASVIVRQDPKVTVEQLRNELPTLSKCASDPHLVQIIQSGGKFSVRELSARMIADAVGNGLDEGSILYYRTHFSRQVKSKKRGRPRKGK
jgi:hypothetical protein